MFKFRYGLSEDRETKTVGICMYIIQYNTIRIKHTIEGICMEN